MWARVLGVAPRSEGRLALLALWDSELSSQKRCQVYMLSRDRPISAGVERMPFSIRDMTYLACAISVELNTSPGAVVVPWLCGQDGLDVLGL